MSKRRPMIGLVAALAVAFPAAAQTPAATPSPEDDLDCALVASIILESGEDMTAEERTGIVAGMTYFIGRWEAVRGGDLNSAMVERFQQLNLAEFSPLAQTCGTRMEEMGGRMTAAGDAIEALDDRAETAKPAEGSPATDQPEGG